MAKTSNTGAGCRHRIAAGVLFLLVFAAYSNTFQSAWHLDDYPNLVNNSNLHLTALDPDSLVKTLYSRQGSPGSFYRPVACLTFALNWYFGNNNVAGYHLVNISVHFITAFFLFLTILYLFKSPNLARQNNPHAYWIALAAAALWALNPIQTQAVTYIVQRMAAMAAMFYIIAIFLYVNGRIRESSWQQVLSLAGCAVSYVLAVGSKENAVTLPVALFLAEIVFFQNLESPKIRKTLAVAAASIGILLIVICAYLVINAGELSIFQGYQHRSFTLWQRLMTEPRILVFYLSQLLYPMPFRLSIEHDIILSSAVFKPWTNLPAVLLLGILTVAGFMQIKKRPVLAFGLLFFFLNHFIESSFLPLELVFEHRNYLPSLFLSFPLAAGLFGLMDYFSRKNRFIFRSLGAFLVLLVLGLGISTYARNMAWATDKTLWEDAFKKAPGRARPAYNLAKYYAREGQLDMALHLFHQAGVLEASRSEYSRALSLNGMAGIYYLKQDYEQAVKFCQKTLEIDPDFETARYNLTLALAKLGRWDQVAGQIDRLLARRGNSKVYLFLKGELLLKQRRPAEALRYFRKALQAGRSDQKTLLNIGISLNQIQQYHQAEWFLGQVKSKWPDDIRAYIYLIDSSIKAGDPDVTEQYLNELVTGFKVDVLILKMKNCFEDYYLTHPSRDLLCSAVGDKISRLADHMARIGDL